MANTQRQKQQNDQILQIVGFELSGEQFGVDILCIKEIIRVVPITIVPHAPCFVKGIINLRGAVIPVVTLRECLNIENRGFDNDTRVIVVELGEQQVGFIVDSVSRVLRIATSQIEPPPGMIMRIDSAYIRGIIQNEANQGELLLILDLKRILPTFERNPPIVHKAA